MGLLKLLGWLALTFVVGLAFAAVLRIATKRPASAVRHREQRSLDEQVEANLIKVKSRPEFTGKHGWLTFYLCGPPDNLQKLSHALAGQGWINTGSWEGGFIYPKIEADRTAAAIVALANATQTLCDSYGIKVIAIDADTSPDVQRSHVEVLYNAPH